MSHFRRSFIVHLAILLLACLLRAEAGELSPDGCNGTVAAVLWDAPDFASLLPLRDGCWLLTHSQDMVIFLLPPGFEPPGDLKARLIDLGPLECSRVEGDGVAPGSAEDNAVEREGGDYYLFTVEDAPGAVFSGNTRVLLGSGRTALLWSADRPPRLASQSPARAGGLSGPFLITIEPKVWPLVGSEPGVPGQVAPRQWPPCPESPREAVAGAGVAGADAAGPEVNLEPDALATLLAPTDFDPVVDVVVAQVDQAGYVEKWQVLDDFETRYLTRPENEQASQWIHDTLESYGLDAEFHTYSHQGLRRNVIGTLPGVLDASKVLYMTAHFDSVNGSGDQAHAPGADDNASGVAAFLEAARVLSGHRFLYTIRFVGFNSEEFGMIGSRAYVASLPAGEEVIGCYNLDMIAYSGNHPGLSIFTDQRSLPLAQLLSDACEKYVSGYVQPIIRVESLAASDHAPFLEAGLPALLVIEGAVNGYSPWYHMAEDRIERYPPEFPALVTKAAVAAVAQAAIPMPETFEDCNENGIPDLLEIGTGAVADCNGNSVPDECDLASGVGKDCDNNGVPDDCELASGASQDCNGNGTPDACDIASGLSQDCDQSGVPDDCEIASGIGKDCNGNSVPDGCDIASGLSQDCDKSGVPDDCELASGAGRDCNGNGTPDACDIASGLCEDEDSDGIPDTCEGGLQRPGDANQDGALDLSDAVWILGHLFLGNPGQETLPCESGTASSPGAGDLALADVNGDGRIDLSDPASILGFLFLGSNPPALGTDCVRIPGCPETCGDSR